MAHAKYRFTSTRDFRRLRSWHATRDAIPLLEHYYIIVVVVVVVVVDNEDGDDDDEPQVFDTNEEQDGGMGGLATSAAFVLRIEVFAGYYEVIHKS